MCTSFGWPKPEGPHLVGTSAWQVVDALRIDPWAASAAAGPRGLRAVMVNAWYPTTAAEASRLGGTVGFPEGGVLYPRPAFTLLARQEPLPNTLRQLAAQHGLPGAALSQVTHLTTYARAGAPLAAGPWPVLLFSHGYGLENAMTNSYLLETLASHGYVVLSVSHPGESLATIFPDGRLRALDFDDPRLNLAARLAEVRTEGGPWGELAAESLALWTADLKTVLDDLERLNTPGPDKAWAGQLDLSRVGALGIGLGGSAALALAADDARVRAVASLDGRWSPSAAGAWPTINQPVLALGRGGPTPPGATALTLRGAQPLHFTGVALWFPILSQLADFEAGPVYRYQHALNAYALAFFNRHLRGEAAPLLDGPAAEHPDVEFAARAG
jgi:hypothetical protein